MEHCADVLVTAPELDRLRKPPGKAVADQLRTVLELGGEYDLAVIHRDGDGQGRDARTGEIREAVEAVMPGVPHVPVVPIRMTEAWLLLDKGLIRQVAGNPNGRVRLDLPTPAAVERIAEPKATLKDVLARASELSGRRLALFHQRFGSHRRQLLERLDPEGPVRHVRSWQLFVADLSAVLTTLCRSEAG